MRKPLNLSSRPFENETLPAVLFVMAVAFLGALTLGHGLWVRHLRSERYWARQREMAALQKEMADLQAREKRLKRPEPSEATLTQWRQVKELVDRRTFSWTDLLSRLEDVMPMDARLVSIVPKVQKDGLFLDISVRVREPGTGLRLSGLLEDRSEFDQVRPLRINPGSQGDEYTYSMRYLAPPAESPDQPEPKTSEAGPARAEDAAGAREERS